MELRGNRKAVPGLRIDIIIVRYRFYFLLGRGALQIGTVHPPFSPSNVQDTKPLLNQYCYLLCIPLSFALFILRISRLLPPLQSMLCAQSVPRRSPLRNVQLRALQTHLTRRIYTTRLLPLPSTSVARTARRQAARAPSPLLLQNFATSPARRKEQNPDDTPDPIPVTQNDADKLGVSDEDGKEVLEKAEEESAAEAKSEPGQGAAGSKGSVDGKGAAVGGGSEGGSGSGDGGRKGRKISSEKALQKPTVPEVYPQLMAIPIAKRPLFPGFYKAITIKDPNVTAAIQEMMKRGQPYVGAFLFKDENSDKDIIDNVDDVHDVGVFAQITSAFPVHGQENSLTAVLYPHRRIKMSSLIPPSRAKDRSQQSASTTQSLPATEAHSPKEASQASEKPGDVVASFEESSQSAQPTDVQPYEPTSFLRNFAVSLVNVENMVEQLHDPKSPVIKAVTSEIVNVFKDVANLNPLFRDQISTFSMSQSAGNIMDEPGKLADFAAAVSAGEIAELQDVLETMSVEERLTKALMVLKKELMNAQLQNKISKDVENKIQKRQREYWLMEQMKGIRRELGIETDGKDKLVEKFRERASGLAMPEAVKKVFDEELNKLAHLEPAASEFNVTRNYLDWLTQIPWGQRSAENFGIANAMTVLDEDHHGLKDIKERILEFIAVGKLRGNVEGKILCFVGPPGVGK